MVALLEKSDGSEGFHQIVDFLNASHIREQEIISTVDGHAKTVTIAYVRKYLKLADAGGLSSLPNTQIFDQLSLIGCAITSDKFTSQKGHFSPQWRLLSSHKRTYITPTLTQKLFSNMRRATKGYYREETPLFPTMLAIDQPGQGEGSAIPAGSQHTPFLAPSTKTHSDTRAQSPVTELHTSPPQITEPPTSSIIRETIRQEVEIPQSNFPTQTLVANEAAFTGVNVVHGRAATTVSSIDARQGSEQTATGKEISNPLIADSLLKTIRYLVGLGVVLCDRGGIGGVDVS
ncbi:hypothetical protein Tco_0669898 [Tanacetum coccineum]